MTKEVSPMTASQRAAARAIQAECVAFAAKNAQRFKPVYSVDRPPPNQAAANARRVALTQLREEVKTFLSSMKAIADAAGISKPHLRAQRIAVMTLHQNIDREFEVLSIPQEVVAKEPGWNKKPRRRR